MASMRAFITTSLIARTLGSELGEERDTSPHSPEGMESDDEDDYEHYYEPPAPLPAKVSAALSSLAIALAPHHEYSGPRSSPNLHEQGPSVEAFKLARIPGRDRSDPPLVEMEEKPSTPGWEDVESWEEIDNHVVRCQPSSTVRAAPKLHVRPIPVRGISSGTDTSVALAHRRRPSGLPKDSVRANDALDLEPTSIPAQVVHDVLCIIAIIVEWVECAVIVIFRILVDIRYGRRATL